MKNILFSLGVSLCLLVLFCAQAFAEPVVITTGAGYKPMVEELAEAYKKSGGKIEEMYGGHIGQMLLQMDQGSGVNVVISDKSSLDALAKPEVFAIQQELGGTVLVLIWRKGIEVTTPMDLTKPAIKSVCHPDAKAAIYGRAAAAFLASSGIGKQIEDKLQVVSSVPQVFSYISTGEMDAGFVNRVMVLKGKEKIGGSLEITEGYPPITMLAAVTKGHEKSPNVIKFLAFLRSDQAKAILKQHGIW